MATAPQQTVAILIPVFNDWESVELLVAQIAESLVPTVWKAKVLLVDDASTTALPANFYIRQEATLASVDVLHLRRNLGHQRAIAIGLFHLHEEDAADAVIVMDGDGEDQPEDLPLLLEEFERAAGQQVIFAERTKRMEGALFRSFYHLFRWTHFLLTGISVRVGNYSVLPPLALKRLMVVSELWNHYAAAIFRARIPFRTLPLPRGKRLAGESKMNFVSLVVHGLSAMSVFSDQISARVLLCALAVAAITPGWLATSTPMAALIVLQAVMLAMLLAFVIISGRNNLGFLALRDAHYFILSKTRIGMQNRRQVATMKLEQVKR